MKVLIFGDIHIHNYKQHSIHNSRLNVGLDMLSDIYKEADQRGIKYVLCTGDIFDTHQVISTVVVNALTRRFIKLAEQYPDITMVAISGNHDQARKNLLNSRADTALTYLQEVVPRFILIDNEGMHLGEGVHVLGIPYYEYPEHYQQVLQETVAKVTPLINRDKKILLIHQTPRFINNPNIPYDTDPFDEVYSNFTDTFCGHIHHKQLISDNFMLTGSPGHRDMADVGDIKGIWEYDTDTREKVFISNEGKYPEFKQVRIRLGDPVPDDGFNYYEPVYIDSMSMDHVGVGKKDFDYGLAPETLVRRYYEQIGGDDAEMLGVGIACVLQK